ncbi:type IV pilus modification PilV family protein [Alienimonas californiensis]|uniref:Prepilin-type N-terminal cleavage/methylation domain-containing protein n=1 Tax=Alienimonas californiensis TaxID=2527989 RepID=A0A517P8Y1_9PLAN|nr:hypothetical protein [Alienimonas californiensis]QDT15828.1 hypothetical protein CA12_19230 [Alienimonas californiensis]
MRRRSGTTLLEVVAASIVLAIALAPALRMTREAVQAADRLDRQERCLTVASDLVELGMARTAADWDGRVGIATVLPIAVPGYPGMKALELTSDSAAYGGVPGRLATVGAFVWYDEDGDSVVDSTEPQVLLASAVARMASYESHAGS